MREIFIVDDDEAVRRSLVFMLRLSGWSPRAFGRAEDFLTEADALPPGVLLTDIRMPGMDGFQLLTEMKRRGLRFRALVMTGHDSAGLRARALGLGALGVLAKPFDEGVLAAALARTA